MALTGTYFNSSYYIDHNADVAALWSGTALSHYEAYGAAENRAPNSWFNAQYYRATYSDLSSMTALQLFEHYEKYGYAEGRVTSAAYANFDAADYLASYADLGANGITLGTALNHYLVYGIAENRIAHNYNGSVISTSTGQSYTLTTTVDDINITDLYSVNTVNGVVDGDGDGDTAQSTFSIGDTINGNELTLLRLILYEAGNAAYATVSDIDQVNLVNANGGAVTFDAGDWTNINSINMTAGASGGAAVFNNLEDGVNLEISVTGSLTANYVSGEKVSLVTNDADDSATFVDGDVDVTVAASSTVSVDVTSTADLTVGDITAAIGDSASLSVDLTASGDLTVGDVMATIGDGTNASFWLEMSASGDLTVGDITIAGGVDASGSAWLQNVGGSVTVGDVDISMDPDASGTDSYAGLYITNETSTGDVTVGDVSLSVGPSGSLDLYIEHTGTSGDSIGGVTVGDITLNLSNDATGDVTIDFTTTVTAGTETMGALTVGNMDVTLGADASLSVDIYSTMFGVSAMADAQGDVTIGALTATLGIGASMDYSLTVNNSASGDIGSVTVGDVTVNADDGATFSWDADISATSGDVGTVTIGNLDAAIGVSGYMSYTADIYAGGDIGSVIIGDVDINLHADASLSMEYTVSATGNIDSITIGDVNVELGQSASVTSFSYDIHAAGNINSVVIGDLNTTIGASADFDDYSIDVSASGSIDSVTVGNVTAVIGAGGSFSYSATVSGDTGVGAVTFGDFDITSNGASSASLELLVNAATGDVGTVTIGDVSLDANTTSTIDWVLDVNASGDAGTVNIGTIDVNVTVSSSVSVDINSSAGTDADIHLAGFALHGTALTAANYVFNIGDGLGGLSGDVTIDSIVIDVSATATGLFDLSDILTDVSTTGTVTLGTIDYSDYALTGASTTGASIDVSGFAGDIVVIGSDLDDTITDNTGTNTLTGNDGADTFSFVTMNANGVGLTAAGADVITDFEHGVDTIELDTTAAFTADQYFEGTYASFALFLAGAATQMTSAPEDNLVAGQVGNDVYIAVDMNDGDSVDTVIQLTGVTLANLDFADFAFV